MEKIKSAQTLKGRQIINLYSQLNFKNYFIRKYQLVLLVSFHLEKKLNSEGLEQKAGDLCLGRGLKGPREKPQSEQTEVDRLPKGWSSLCLLSNVSSSLAYKDQHLLKEVKSYPPPNSTTKYADKQHQ